MYFLNHTSNYKIRIQVGQKHAINLPILSSLILLFGNGRIEARLNKAFYTFVISGLGNCQQAVQYFDSFPLYTSKKAKSLKTFKELMQSLQNKDHLKGDQILEELIIKAAGMNKYSNYSKLGTQGLM